MDRGQKLLRQAEGFFKQLKKLSDDKVFGGTILHETDYIAFQIELGLTLPILDAKTRSLLLAQNELLRYTFLRWKQCVSE